MKSQIKILTLITLFVPMLLLAFAGNAFVGENTFTHVDLDQFIETERTADKGKKVIRMGKPIIFEASLKQYPHKREMSYVFTALELSRFDPLPEVEYRMFVESKGGVIHPVYVENQLVQRIKDQLKEGDSTAFVGYHLYNYTKGPAILIVDFSR